MRTEIGELSGISAGGGDPTNLRTLGIVSGATTSAGALGFLLSKTIGFSCPFRSMGFACPGCGCSQAVVPMVKFSQVMLMLVLLSASSNWVYQLVNSN